MNKKVMKAVFVAAIAMVSGINVFNAQKSEGLSDIAWANVEALASGETTVECCASLWGTCKDGSLVHMLNVHLINKDKEAQMRGKYPLI